MSRSLKERESYAQIRHENGRFWTVFHGLVANAQSPNFLRDLCTFYQFLAEAADCMLAQLKGAFWTTSQLQQLKAAFKAAGKKLGDFEREVDRDVQTITLDDQGGTGADGEA